MKVGNSDFYFEINEMELKQKLVPLQIVISGNVLGTLDDTTYLPFLLSSLELILKETYYYDESINCNNYKSRFFLNGDFCSGYRITLEDSFDDFIKRCARNDKKVFFAWKLNDDAFFNYEEIDGDDVFFLALI
ncbi:hypothetical protein [Pasteurella testudinis]|uniref:hypothetical protein n=1 Tax=Pasteurella testudinis TaxID=761 RepID=UPI0040598BA5